MPDERETPRIREHLREMREAVGGLSRDVKTDVTDAPRALKEGTKNAFARAAGIRRTPMREWTAPSETDSK